MAASCATILGIDQDYSLGDPGGAGGLGGTATGGSAGSGGTAGGGPGGSGGTAAGGSGGSGAAGGSPPLSCAAQYPVAPPIQQITEETASTCNLCVSTVGQSCRQICAANGGECLDSHNDNPNDSCVIDPSDVLGCDHQGFSSEICTCTLGCGAGPPCTPPAECTGGVCQ